MTPRLVVRPQAQAEIRDARRWYERQAPGLGQRFLGELDAVLPGCARRRTTSRWSNATRRAVRSAARSCGASRTP
jgi:plasmid stabilization system protein ParE